MDSTVTKAIKKYKVKAVIQLIFGYIIAINCGIISVVGAGASGFTEAADIILVTIFAGITALGILLIVKGNRKNKIIKLFNDYSVRLFADPDRSFDLLASATGTSVKDINKNISEMVTAGFFPNSYIDTTYNRLITPDNLIPKATKSTTNSYVEKCVTIQCKGCGATNKIKVGTVSECEFCGSQISAD